MMDLSTQYMGIRLACPLVASASPLSRDLDNIKRLEDVGGGAVVMYSLFEEQIIHEQKELQYYLSRGNEHFAEALTYYPSLDEYHLEPDLYLEHIRKAKESTDLPIIASLNGVSNSGWSAYAARMEEAGAHAVELNIYYLPTRTEMSREEVENLYLENLETVKNAVSIPVSMKLGPFFTAMANMAKRLDDAGADALVLFNRFYQPDINIDELKTEPSIALSSSADSRLPLRWIAILHGRINASLAATGGIHTARDAIKMLMAGADVTMLCSVLLKEGIEKLGRIRSEMSRWMESHDYGSVRDLKGIMSHKSVADPDAFERANYMRALNAYRLPSSSRW